VAGEGPSGYTANLKGLVAELEMEDRIEWLGFTEGSSKWHFIDQIDVLAMPSQYECFGMAAAEAIARGTPIIDSQHTGMGELTKQFDCGIISPPTVGAFADAIAAVESDRASLAKLAAAGPAAAQQALSLQAYGEAIHQEYERLASHDWKSSERMVHRRRVGNCGLGGK
jgi:glycosyltransferase involved in cell wall biosynthesis